MFWASLAHHQDMHIGIKQSYPYHHLQYVIELSCVSQQFYYDSFMQLCAP